MIKKLLSTIIIIGLIFSIIVPLVGSSSGYYVGSINSDVYHYPSCSYADRISPNNLIYFDTPEDAINAGYRPCKVCKPPTSSQPTPTPIPSLGTGGGGGGSSPTPRLQTISVNIEPKNVTALPNETINYKITADWSPKTWSGNIDVVIKLQGFGFEKDHQYIIETSGMTPPIEYTTSFKVPENVPPSTYKAILTAKQPTVFQLHRIQS